MPSSFFFNGQTYYTPTTASQVNDSGFAPSTLGVGNTVAILGDSYGGVPNVPVTFSDPDDAQNSLIQGDLATACVKAFAPSTATGTPGKVIAMRVGQATPATLNLNNSGAAPIVSLTTTQCGYPAGQTKVSIALGSANTSSVRTYLVSVAQGNTLISQDNIGRTAFTISYSGTQATATIQVTGASVVLCAPAATPVLTLDLTVFMTVDQVVDQINSVPGFAASLGLFATGTPTLNALDYAPAAQDCKTAPFVVTASTQAVIEWFNSQAVGLVTAVRIPGPTSYLAQIPWTFLTGNTQPALLVGDWTNALAALQSVDCQWVAVLSSNPAVWAAADAHVQYMSQVARMERRAFVGPALGTSIATVETYPIALNSDRTAICFPGYQDYDINTGALVTLPSYQTAALVAACFAGLPPGQAMTNKSVAVRGLEILLRNPTDTDGLIRAGVLCLQRTNAGINGQTQTGFQVVRSISTWVQNNNFDKVEVSTGAAVDYMMRSVREAVDKARGSSSGPQLIGLAISTAQSILEDLAKPAPQGPGIIVGDANSPAYQNITASISGDQLQVYFEASPVIPNNFIGVTATLTAYSGSASA